jgi:hypothetical protein
LFFSVLSARGLGAGTCWQCAWPSTVVVERALDRAPHKRAHRRSPSLGELLELLYLARSEA